jgi:hypothetical protein
MEIFPKFNSEFIKKSILTLSIIIITVIMLTNCQSLIKKEDRAKDKAQVTESNFAEAQGDSVKVQPDTTTAYRKFLIESENRINAYEKEIADLKIKIAKEKKTEKANYEKKLAELEQKKETLKTKVIDYQDRQIDDWTKKQIEFRKDLDDLGSAITDFFVQEE